MPKKTKVAVPVVNRRALSRREREERFRRWLYVGVAMVGALVVGVVALGFYEVGIVAPSSPVAVVDGTPIRTDTWQRHVQYQRYNLRRYLAQLQGQMAQLDPNDQSTQAIYGYFQQQQQQLQSEYASLPTLALDSLIDNELIRKEAARRKLSVGPEEVQKAIEEGFGYNLPPVTPIPTPAASATPVTATLSPTTTPAAATAPVTPTPSITATPEPTPTPMTEQQFKELFGSMLQDLQKNAGMSEAEYRNQVQMELLRNKLQEALASEVPTATEQIHARQVVLASEEEAKAALERLKKGEEWAVVAKEVSQDAATKENGGDLGWLPQGQRGDDFDKAAFALQPGQTGDPVKIGEQYYIIKVEERDPNRPLDEPLLAQKRSQALEDWLTGQRGSGAVRRMSIEGKAPKDIGTSGL